MGGFTKATQARRDIVAAASFGTHLRGSEHFDALHTMFAGHYCYETHRARGIAGFLINLFMGNPRLSVIHDDGTVEPFSYGKPDRYTGTPRTEEAIVKDRLYRSMRCSIALDGYNFKRRTRQWDTECTVCRSIDFGAALHADHFPVPFVDIRNDFIKENPDHPKEFDDPDAAGHYTFKEGDEWGKKWYQYHKEKAQYRLACAQCNMSQGSKHRRKN